MAIKKGRRDGTTLLAHSIRPSFAATKLFFEKTTRQIVKRQKIAGKIFFRIDKKINLGFDFDIVYSILLCTFIFCIKIHSFPIKLTITFYEKKDKIMLEQ